MAPQKAVRVTAAIGVLWLVALLLFLPVLFPLLQAPAILSGFTLVLGAAMWVAVFSSQTKKALRKIEKQETKVAFVNFRLGRALVFTFALCAAGIAVILLGFYIAYYQPFWAFLINLLIPFPAATSLAAAVLYWRWERKNNKTLLLEDGRIFAKPQVCNISQV